MLLFVLEYANQLAKVQFFLKTTKYFLHFMLQNVYFPLFIPFHYLLLGKSISIKRRNYSHLLGIPIVEKLKKCVE